jgi:hypothetical protein
MKSSFGAMRLRLIAPYAAGKAHRMRSPEQIEFAYAGLIKAGNSGPGAAGQHRGTQKQRALRRMP